MDTTPIIVTAALLGIIAYTAGYAYSKRLRNSNAERYHLTITSDKSKPDTWEWMPGGGAGGGWVHPDSDPFGNAPYKPTE